MIPVLQADYYKYMRMFRGNYLKGATLLRSLLNDTAAREHILQSLPALSAIFTDFSSSEATKLCYNVLSEKGYLEQAIVAYLKGLGATDHETMSELMADAVNVIELICNEELYPLIQQDSNLLKKLLKKQATLDELKLDKNTKALFNEDVLATLSSIQSRSSTNIYTSYKAFVDSLDEQTTSFDILETYYSFTADYNSMVLDDKNRRVFLPVQIHTEHISSGDDYYYPAVLRYDITSKEWSILHIAMTGTKVTSSVKAAKGIAYDSEQDLLYLFYRQDGTTQMNCDMVIGTTGSPIKLQIPVGAVGSGSYMAPYFCHFDETEKVAKFVWSVADISTTDSSCGWLYGCSIDYSGIVWQGIVSMPTSEAPDYYSSEMYEVMEGHKARCPKGAFVGCMAESSATTSKAYMVCIVHSGSKMVSKYIELPASTDAADFYKAGSSYITDNGLFLFLSADAVYGGSNVDALLAIDVSRGKLLKSYTGSSSKAYTLYTAPLVHKLGFSNSATEGEYTYIGVNGSGSLVTHTTSTLHSLFTNTHFLAKGTERYKLYNTGAYEWLLYDYKGGFTS